MRLLLLFLFLNFMTPMIHAYQYPVKLGDTTVYIVQERHGNGKSFIHLHQNETTALKAARAVIRTEGGSLLTLVHSGQRNIRFTLHKKQYEFDPNRIYTNAGIEQTLKAHGSYSDAAYQVVKHFAYQIKKRLPSGKVIAVHNNNGYSLRDYLPGHALAHDARSLTMNERHHFRNFYVVTQKKEYQRLKRLQFNSVWQSLHAKDDGSLSVFLAKRKYVNVEAGYNQLATQISMLKQL